jgi:hypothetical protein
MYKGGKPPVNYPDPTKLRWARPVYKLTSSKKKPKGDDDDDDDDDDDEDEDDDEGWDDEFNDTTYGDDESWCSEAELFKDGMSAGDVKQGKLGDCWFLGAMATLAVKPAMVRKVFWPKSDKKLNQLRDYGIFVCRFMKDFVWYYVIIDDKIPVYDTPSGKPVFAHCSDNEELWVLLMEKAYAKLHQTYDALIGGYVDYGLRDMTGLVSEQVVMKPGHLGFHAETAEAIESGHFWRQLCTDWKNGSLMGASIQPDPQSKATSKVEAMAGKRGVCGGGGGLVVVWWWLWWWLWFPCSGKCAQPVCFAFPPFTPPFCYTLLSPGQGLRQRHAYSLLALGEVRGLVDDNQKPYGHGLKFVVLRNPWGFGEWTGEWSDTDDKRKSKANNKAMMDSFCRFELEGLQGQAAKTTYTYQRYTKAMIEGFVKKNEGYAHEPWYKDYMEEGSEAGEENEDDDSFGEEDDGHGETMGKIFKVKRDPVSGEAIENGDDPNIIEQVSGGGCMVVVWWLYGGLVGHFVIGPLTVLLVVAGCSLPLPFLRWIPSIGKVYWPMTRTTGRL